MVKDLLIANQLTTAKIVSPVLVEKSLTKAFGESWANWEPETLWSEINDRFQVASISDEARAVIQAIKTLKVNPEAYTTDLNGFEDITLGLNGHQPNFEAVEVCDPGEIFRGFVFTRFGLLRGQTLKFEPSVISYVRACFREAGVFAMPEEMKEFEETAEKDLRDRIRADAKNWQAGTVDHTNMLSVQAAKLHDIYAMLQAWAIEAKKEMAGNVG